MIQFILLSEVLWVSFLDNITREPGFWPLVLLIVSLLIPVIVAVISILCEKAAQKNVEETYEKIAVKFEYENCSEANEMERLKDYIDKSHLVSFYDRLIILNAIKKIDESGNYYLINLETRFSSGRSESVSNHIIFHIESTLGITQEINIQRKTRFVEFSQKLLGAGGSSSPEVIPGFEGKFFVSTTEALKLYSVLTADAQAMLLKNSDSYPISGKESNPTKITIRNSGIDFTCSYSGKREDVENLVELGIRMVYLIRELMAGEEEVGERDERDDNNR